MSTFARNRSKVVWILGLCFFFSGLTFFALVYFLPYVEIKRLFDFLAPDRDLESFTKELYDALRLPCLAGLLLTTGILAYLLAFKQKAQSRISVILEFASRVLRDWKEKTVTLWVAATHFETDRGVLLLLLSITVLAALNRLPYLWRPMGHDEAYTYIAFASRGLRIAITDYHLPNNHVFHTVLVSIATWLFGDSPAVVRLPVFIAGILIVPAIYILAKSFYSREIGLVSAAILASAPVLIDYSTNARGYMLLALFTVLLFTCGAYVVKNRNEVAWALLVLFASLGIYTNPTMIYPIAVLFAWLLLEGIFGYADFSYGARFYRYLVFAMASIVFVSVLLYMPLVLYSGLDSLIGNNFIAPLRWSDFMQSVPVRIRNTWDEWNRDLPGAVSWIGMTGLAISIALSLNKIRQVALLFAASISGIGTILILQRVAPWPRVWLFLFPLVVMWIAAGLLGFLHFVTQKLTADARTFRLLSGLLIVLPLLAGGIRSYTYFDTKAFSPGELEKAAIYLSETLKPGDVVVVISPDTVILDYYLRRRGIDRSFLELNDSRQFRMAMVLVNTGYGQNLEQVLEERSFSENVNPAEAELMFSANRIEIYALPGTE